VSAFLHKEQYSPEEYTFACEQLYQPDPPYRPYLITSFIPFQKPQKCPPISLPEAFAGNNAYAVINALRELNTSWSALPDAIREAISDVLLCTLPFKYCFSIKKTLTHYLLEGEFDINTSLDSGGMLLETAIRNDDIEFAKFLLSKGANPYSLKLSALFITSEMLLVLM
jgi:ankyrin repeat protein